MKILVKELFITAVCFVACAGWAAQMPDYTGTVFPADNVWNVAVDTLPVHPRSAAYIASIGATTGLHPDFGTTYDGQPIGIPYNLVGAGQAKVSIAFDSADESDPGPYPIPLNPLIEGLNGWTDPTDEDRHLLVIDTAAHLLYETWYTWPKSPTDQTSWTAGSGAIFDLSSNALRPDGWTSSDAAGLPVFAGLVRYDEVARGAINHALRFTADNSHIQAAYIWPARHQANSSTNLNLPPMGQRFRLKANFDISSFSTGNQVILRALKKFGLILADNGSDWYISGTNDDRWNDDDLHALTGIPGSAFEAVDISAWLNNPAFNPDSAAVPGAATGGSGGGSGGGTGGGSGGGTGGGAGGGTGDGNTGSASVTTAETAVFPNPSVGVNPTIRAFVGDADELEITIYDAAGSVVHSDRVTGGPTGTASDGRPYYDYVWMGKKASGVYYAVIHGKKGGAVIRGRVKFAVVR